MWPKTRVTKQLGLKLPIILAPMAGAASTPELVAAVSNSGGLGSLGAGYMEPTAIKAAIHKIRDLTDKPFAVNLFSPCEHKATHAQIERAQKFLIETFPEINFPREMVKPPYLPHFEEQINVVIEEKVAVFSFTFGVPARHFLMKLKEAGILLMGTATTLAEAKLLSEFEVDLIVAQGYEAGGHRGSFLGSAHYGCTGLIALIPQLVDADSISQPIIASGGIMDGRGIVAALALGAEAVQLGTAFLTCQESGISQHFKDKLLQTDFDNTILTRSYTGRLVRCIENEFVKRMENQDKNILNYPMQHALTLGLRKLADKEGALQFMGMWSGQAASLSKSLPAGELVNELNREVKAVLKKLKPST